MLATSEEVALKGIASLGIHERQAEKLRRALLGRRGWEDAAAVLAASFGGLSLDDTPAGVAAGDQAAGGAASAPALDGMAVDGGYASADEDAGLVVVSHPCLYSNRGCLPHYL